MQIRLLIGVAFVLAQAVSSAQSGAAGVEADVRTLDMSWNDAFARCDQDFMRRVFADNLVWIHGAGTISDKQKFIDGLKAPCNVQWSVQKISEVRVYGDVANVLGYMWLTRNNGLAYLIYTRTYVKQNGAWRMAFNQATNMDHIPMPPEITPPLPKSADSHRSAR